MSANLITGNLFKPIYAYQDADYQAGISGNVTSIMPVGSQMALSIEDANTIKADDGVLITKEGRRIQIDAGAIEEWSIPTGTQGQTNYYIVGFRLYTDNTSAEVCETFVEQMENATDTIPEDTFRSGATEVYISLGRVAQNGVNLESVTGLLDTSKSLEAKADKTSIVTSITRNGTNFTAKNSNGTQLFTFNQQDNDTTTGTTYNAGSCPDNTTFGTNGSIKRLYDYANSKVIKREGQLTFSINPNTDLIYTLSNFGISIPSGYTVWSTSFFITGTGSSGLRLNGIGNGGSFADSSLGVCVHSGLSYALGNLTLKAIVILGK